MFMIMAHSPARRLNLSATLYSPRWEPRPAALAGYGPQSRQRRPDPQLNCKGRSMFIYLKEIQIKRSGGQLERP